MPDSVLDGTEQDGLVVRAASLRGDDHRYLGETRQDSMGLWALGGGSDAVGTDVLLACVADGVGSKPLSHLGSAAACRRLRATVEDNLAELVQLLDDGSPRARQDACVAVMDAVSRDLDRLAADRGIDGRSLSTTLVAGLVRAAPGRCRALLFAVGDSPALTLDAGGWRHCFGGEDEGGVLTTATDALPGRTGPVSVTVLDLPAGDLLVLCTDGLGNTLRDGGVRDQLAQWWSGPDVPSLPEFYWQLSFRAQSFGDDRTAVCLWSR